MTRARKPTSEKREAQAEAGPTRRIAADVTARQFRNLHMRLAERGITVRAYLIDLLERDGVSASGPYRPSEE